MKEKVIEKGSKKVNYDDMLGWGSNHPKIKELSSSAVQAYKNSIEFALDNAKLDIPDIDITVSPPRDTKKGIEEKKSEEKAKAKSASKLSLKEREKREEKMEKQQGFKTLTAAQQRALEAKKVKDLEKRNKERKAQQEQASLKPAAGGGPKRKADGEPKTDELSDEDIVYEPKTKKGRKSD